MKVKKLLKAARSPFARHPGLILHKMRQRLHRPFRFASGPASCGIRYPEPLARTLREWASACDLEHKNYSWSCVFKQDYDEKELLDLCLRGPAATEDLRGDIKLVWEFSRGQAFTLNAATARPPQMDECASAIARKMDQWLVHNENPNGANWSCAMEVAIRAVNWICTDALLEGRVAKALGEEKWACGLWNHGRAVWSGLESRLISSNHYIADLMGLFFIGNVFYENSTAKRWKEFAFREMQDAVLAQTYADGGVYEASLPYHCLVTEMALLFCLLNEGALRPEFEQRVSSMCRVMADTMDVDGDVFQIGDNDGGRVIPLDFGAKKLGRAQTLLGLARVIFNRSFEPAPSALYPESGWWVGRSSDFTALLEFGGVGLGGQGSHAHNDNQALAVNWKQKRILIDPGSCLYSSDPGIRNCFRSTAVHSTLMIDNREQISIPLSSPDDLFSLPGSSRAGTVLTRDDAGIAVESRVGGPGGVFHMREVRMRQNSVEVTDRVRGSGCHKLAFIFHMHPDVCAEEAGSELKLHVDGAGDLRLSFRPENLCIVCARARYSPFYGQSRPSSLFRVETTCCLPFTLTWTLEKMPC